jgi:hypothetical protein
MNCPNFNQQDPNKLIKEFMRNNSNKNIFLHKIKLINSNKNIISPIKC